MQRAHIASRHKILFDMLSNPQASQVNPQNEVSIIKLDNPRWKGL